MTVLLLRRPNPQAPYTVAAAAQPGDPALAATDTGDYLSIDDTTNPPAVHAFTIHPTDDAAAQAATAAQAYRQARGHPPADETQLGRWLHTLTPALLDLDPQP